MTVRYDKIAVCNFEILGKIPQLKYRALEGKYPREQSNRGMGLPIKIYYVKHIPLIIVVYVTDKLISSRFVEIEILIFKLLWMNERKKEFKQNFQRKRGKGREEDLARR